MVFLAITECSISSLVLASQLLEEEYHSIFGNYNTMKYTNATGYFGEEKISLALNILHNGPKMD